MTVDKWTATYTLRDAERLDRAVTAVREADATQVAVQALANARALAPGPPITVCLVAVYPTAGSAEEFATAGGVLTMAGGSNASIGIDPEAAQWEYLTAYAVARVYCRLFEADCCTEPDEPFTLLEALASVGKEHSFGALAQPGPAAPQVQALTPEEEAAHWELIRDQLESDDMRLIADYLFSHPGPGVPIRAGHTIGYHIVQNWLAQHPDATIDDWIRLDAETLLAESGYAGAATGS